MQQTLALSRHSRETFRERAIQRRSGRRGRAMADACFADCLSISAARYDDRRDPLPAIEAPPVWLAAGSGRRPAADPYWSARALKTSRAATRNTT